MADGNTFNGSFTLTPSVRAAVQSAGFGSVGSAPRIVAIIGLAKGGKPGTVYKFSDPNSAVAILRGGELLQALFRAFNPAKDGSGPSTIYALRVDPATQAKLTLLDGASANSIVITSANWGALDNLISIAVAAGTISGKKVTVANPNGSYVLDNLGREAFSVHYTGTGSAATMTINGTALTTVCTGASGDNLNLLFASYTTLAQLVNALNATGKYTATVLSPNGADATASNLDFVTAQDIKGVTFTVTENLAAIIAALNSNKQPLVTAVRAAGAGAVPANISATFLTGGTESGDGSSTHLDGTANGGATTSNADWGFCLGVLDTQDVRYISVLTSDSTVWALADLHAETVSAAGYLPRRNFLGTALGLFDVTLGSYIPLAAALNSNRSSLVPQGVIDNDDQTGALTTYPPYIYAAQLAGLAATKDIGDAITQQLARGIGLEWIPSAAQIDAALAAGLLISTFNVRRQAVQAVRGITTWLADNLFQNVEMSVGDEVDDVVLEVLTEVAPFLGKKGSPVLLVQLASATQSALQRKADAGILVGDTAPEANGSFSPPYKNITASILGDVGTLRFTCSPGIPLNFIDVTMSLNVFTGSVQIATA